MTNYNTYVRNGLLGAFLGASGGALYNVLRRRDIFDPKAILVGTALGGGSGLIYARSFEKQKARNRKHEALRLSNLNKDGEINTGVYFGNQTFLYNPWSRSFGLVAPNVRHSFVTVIKDKPFRDSIQISQHRHAVIYELYNIGHRWRPWRNGKTTATEATRPSNNDVAKRLHSYMDPKATPEYRPDVHLYKITDNPEYVDEVERIWDAAYQKIPLNSQGFSGTYNFYREPGEPGKNGNCHSFSAALLSLVPKNYYDISSLPKRIGRGSGVPRENIDSWRTIIDPNTPPKIEGAERYFRPSYLLHLPGRIIRDLFQEPIE